MNHFRSLCLGNHNSFLIKSVPKCNFHVISRVLKISLSWSYVKVLRGAGGVIISNGFLGLRQVFGLGQAAAGLITGGKTLKLYTRW